MFEQVLSWITGSPFNIFAGLLGGIGLYVGGRYFKKLNEEKEWKELKKGLGRSGEKALSLSRSMKRDEEAMTQYKIERKKELALLRKEQEICDFRIDHAQTKAPFTVFFENIPDGEPVYIDSYKVGVIHNGKARILLQTGGIRTLSVPNYISKEINILEG